MDLFSVSCITCRAKLTVKQLSAIGQILPCPKCGGMVQIVAPDGWTPPVAPAAAPKRAAAPAPSAAPAAGQVYTAQLADDDPLSRPRATATPAEKRVRLVLLGIVGLVSLILIGYGLWSTLGSSDGDADVAAGDSSASPTPSLSRTSTATAGRNTAATSTANSPAAGTSSATPAGGPSGTSAPPTASGTGPTGSGPTGSGLAASSPSGSARPPRGSPSASTPMVVVLATPTPTAAPLVPPAASATSTKPVAAPMGTNPAGTVPLGNAPPAVDIAPRLQEKIPALKFEGTPLRAALAAVAELAGVPLRFDWSTLPLDFRPDDPVSLQTEQATLGEVFERLTKERGLRVVANNGVLEVAGPAAGDAGPQVVDHPIDDLFGSDEAAAESGARLVRAFVAPETWNAPGGGSLVAAPGKLVISQTPQVQEQAALFLNRLRTARGKPPRAAGGAAAVAPPAETRVSRARAILQRPVTMNFRPGVPLPSVLTRLEEATKAPIVVDYGALTAAGYSVDEPVGISAHDHPVGDVLDALCRPRAWGWSMPRDSVIELTSLEAARSRTYVEFYDVRPLVGDQSAEAFTARVLDATSELGWNEAGSRAAMGFDQPSGRLIVRQSLAGHLRLERLWTEAAAPAGAAPAPTAGPTGSVPAPAASPTGR